MPNRSILARILGAVVPVCEGINLTYFFSYIDSTGWGCGTKLPHNVTSLLGVMDGAASDLRLGLALAGGRNPRAPAAAVRHRNHAPGDPEDHGARTSWCAGSFQRLGPVVAPRSSFLRIQVFHQNQFHPYQPETTELPKAAVFGRLVSRSGASIWNLP